MADTAEPATPRPRFSVGDMLEGSVIIRSVEWHAPSERWWVTMSSASGGTTACGPESWFKGYTVIDHVYAPTVISEAPALSWIDVKEGDSVRMKVTKTYEGIAKKDGFGGFAIEGIGVVGPGRTIEVIQRAVPILPREPNTWWLDKDKTVWFIGEFGTLVCLESTLDLNPQEYAPFEQLFLKGQADG